MPGEQTVAEALVAIARDAVPGAPLEVHPRHPERRVSGFKPDLVGLRCGRAGLVEEGRAAEPLADQLSCTVELRRAPECFIAFAHEETAVSRCGHIAQVKEIGRHERSILSPTFSTVGRDEFSSAIETFDLVRGRGLGHQHFTRRGVEGEAIRILQRIRADEDLALLADGEHLPFGDDQHHALRAESHALGCWHLLSPQQSFFCRCLQHRLGGILRHLGRFGGIEPYEIELLRRDHQLPAAHVHVHRTTGASSRAIAIVTRCQHIPGERTHLAGIRDVSLVLPRLAIEGDDLAILLHDKQRTLRARHRDRPLPRLHPVLLPDPFAAIGRLLAISRNPFRAFGTNIPARLIPSERARPAVVADPRIVRLFDGGDPDHAEVLRLKTR